MEIVNDMQTAETSSSIRICTPAPAQTPPSHEEKQLGDQLEGIGLVRGFVISATSIQNIECHTHFLKAKFCYKVGGDIVLASCTPTLCAVWQFSLFLLLCTESLLYQ